MALCVCCRACNLLPSLSNPSNRVAAADAVAALVATTSKPNGTKEKLIIQSTNRTSRMTPDEATVELYKYIHTHGSKSRLNDIQKYVEAGARLSNIETLYGPPLLYALNCLCDISILKYLIEKGGIDWSYKKGHYEYYFEDYPCIQFIPILYNTFQNALLQLWHFCKGSHDLDDNVLEFIFKSHGYKEEEYKNYLYNSHLDCTVPVNYKKVALQRQETYNEYILQVCELFGVSPENLETGVLELPDHPFDITLLPAEDKPYCWNTLMDKPVGCKYAPLKVNIV
jgi:hypothetical protein